MLFLMWAGGICLAGLVLVLLVAFVVQRVLKRENADPEFSRKMDVFRMKSGPVLKNVKSLLVWCFIIVFMLYWLHILE